MAGKKERKPMFAKTAPKVKEAMNSKIGQGVQKGLGIIGTITSIAGGLLAIGGAIIAINEKSQARIDKAREIEMKLDQ